MPFTVQRLSNESIVVVTYEEPFNYGQDIHAIREAIASIAEEIEGPIYDVHDTSQLHLNLGKVVIALNTTFANLTLLGKTTTLVVGSGLLFNLAEKTVNQRQNKVNNFLFFQTSEEAIVYAQKARISFPCPNFIL